MQVKLELQGDACKTAHVEETLTFLKTHDLLANNSPFTLHVSDEYLSLSCTKLPHIKPLAIDFLSGAIKKRIQTSYQSDPFVKAMGAKKSLNMTLFDLTSGLGEDAWIAASLKYRVISFERNPILFLLLNDGLRRARRQDIGSKIDLSFKYGDSRKLQAPLVKEDVPSTVYLDPMFNSVKTKSLPSGPIQILRMIEAENGDDETSNEIALLETALSLTSQRVVLKRPLRGPTLLKPSHSVEGRSVRYDIYILP